MKGLIQAPGDVIGVGGSGLVDASWAASKFVAELGRRGEIWTATILNAAARVPGGPTVLHHVQAAGSSADIDHVLVTGKVVTLIDSKVWKPATYWTLGGVHRRSSSLLSHEVAPNVPVYGDIERSRHRLRLTLEQAGIADAELVGPVFVVWPSKDGGAVGTQMLNLGPGTRVIPGAQLERTVRRWARNGPADRRIVEAIASTFPDVDDRS